MNTGFNVPNLSSYFSAGNTSGYSSDSVFDPVEDVYSFDDDDDTCAYIRSSGERCKRKVSSKYRPYCNSDHQRRAKKKGFY